LRHPGIRAEWLDEFLAEGNGIEVLNSSDVDSEDGDAYIEGDDMFAGMELVDL